MRFMNKTSITLLYLVMSIVMTWPLAAHLPSRLASDEGDPAFNCWILLWTSGQVAAALRGHVSALADYWNGNIFHPAQLTLAYSEHLTPQMLQVLPLHAVTGNIILAYNLLFLSTFVLSGLAMFLLVRDLTGRPAAAFLAGLIYAYVPYRFDQLSHVQVLSSYWMPLALLGFRRFFGSRSHLALAGGAGALVLQALSCGYYLLFFTPFAAAYCLVEIAGRRLWRDRRMWTSLAIAALSVALVLWPFVSPYLRVRQVEQLGTRTAEEISLFSADTHAFATAPGQSRVWGERVSARPAPEGQGFFGFTGLLFGAVGLIDAARRRVSRAPWRQMAPWRRVAVGSLAALFLWQTWVLIVMFIDGQFVLSLPGSLVIWRNASGWRGPLTISVLSLFALVALTRTGNSTTGDNHSIRGFVVFSFFATCLLALGPVMRAAGHVIGAGPYAWLLHNVPGFDGLRVPSRFFMVAAFFLAVLAGFGAHALLNTRHRRLAAGVIALGFAGVLLDGWAVPMPMGRPRAQPPYAAPAELATGAAMNPIYRLVRELPAPAVLIELPIGEQNHDIQAAFYAGCHRRRLVNGYSGFEPAGYAERARSIMRALSDPAGAAATLAASGATHVLVHEAMMSDGSGQRFSDWLRSIGATEIGRQGSDALVALR
jgi:hypothetical protein